LFHFKFSVSQYLEGEEVQSKEDERNEMFNWVIAIFKRAVEELPFKEGDEVEQRLGCVWWYNRKVLKWLPLLLNQVDKYF
jgi:hypothetical protein